MIKFKALVAMALAILMVAAIFVKAIPPSPVGEIYKLVLKDSYYFYGTSGCSKFFMVLANDGTALGTAKPNQFCTLAEVELEVKPGETKVIGTWDQVVYGCEADEVCIGHNVAPGTYVIKAEFSDKPGNVGSKFTITKSIGIVSNNNVYEENILIVFWNWLMSLFK
ncbi:hypothetical protein HYX18_02875 [Candidatus Woesearchaeota archaeon]|nr:hypothetical protein [Candidatus Woesearchaeota archaeon]